MANPEIPFEPAVRFCTDKKKKRESDYVNTGKSQRFAAAVIKAKQLREAQWSPEVFLKPFFIMKALFFIAALLVSCLAEDPTEDPTKQPTEDECKSLIEPLPADKIPKMDGTVYLLYGYADQEDFRKIMQLTDSYSANISTTSDNEVVINQRDKINGTCIASRMKMTFEGNTARASLPNMTSDHYFLPTCDGCLLALVNSSAINLRKLLQDMGIDPLSDAEQVTGRALYLMANETTIDDSELERLKKQARCLGFPEEPDFRYDPKHSFCQEGEGIRIPDF